MTGLPDEELVLEQGMVLPTREALALVAIYNAINIDVSNVVATNMAFALNAASHGTSATADISQFMMLWH